MEDSLQTIVYIVIFALIAIFNIVAKNKQKQEKEKKLRELQKKQQEAQMNTTEGEVKTAPTREKSDPLSEFLKKVLEDEKYKEEEIIEEEQVHEEPLQDRVKEMEFEKTALQEYSERKEREAKLAAEKEEKQETPVLVEEESGQIPEKKEQINVVNSIRSGKFNAREAIIYAEILERKY